MSQLLANGHPNADNYPLAHLWSEVRIVRKRENQKMTMEALLLRSVAVSVMDSQAGTKLMKDLLTRLEGND